MSRQKSLATNSAFAAVQVLWTTAVLFVVYRIATHYAGVGLLGLWSSAIAVIAIAALADCGLTDLMVRQVAEARGQNDYARVKRLYRTLTAFSGVTIGLAVSALVPMVVAFLAAATPETIRPSIWWLAAAASLTVWLNTISVGLFGVLEAFGRYDLKFWATLGNGSVTVVTALIFIPRSPVLGTAATFVAGAAVGLAIAWIANANLLREALGTAVRTPNSRFIPWRELRSLIGMGVQVRLAGIFLLGLEPVTRILLVRFAGLDVVGLYELAYRAVFQLRNLVVSALQVLVPGLVAIRAQDPEKAATLLSRATYHAIVIGLPAFVLVACLMPLLSLAMLGKLEWVLAQFALLLVAAWSINAIAAPNYFANLAEGHVRRNWAAHLTIGVLNIALGLYLGVLFGGLGVVAAASLAIIGGSCVTFLSRRAAIVRARFSLTSADWGVLLVGGLCVAVVYALWGASRNPLSAIVASTTALVCYASVVTIRIGADWLKRHRQRAYATN